MDLLSKNRILTGGIFILVLLNIAALGTLWWQAGKGPGPVPPGRGAGPREFLEDQLRLSEAQRAQFEELRELYQRESEPIVMQLKVARRGLYDALRSGGPSGEVVVPKTEEIGKLHERMELLTLRHFQSLRALCDEGQRRKFDGIMRDVFERVSPLPPPGDRTGGREGADRIPGPPPAGGPPPG
jgi:hypothetical protein